MKDHTTKIIFGISILLSLIAFTPLYSQEEKPLQLVMIGLSHGHAPWLFDRENKNNIKLVGIYEPDPEIIQDYSSRYDLDENLFYSELDEMLNDVKPEAAVAFGSIYHHLQAVKATAPKGIHVMLEKPLAINNKHASEMAGLAKKNNIHLLTNYETSWYPTTEKTYQIFRNSDREMGEIRKMVFHHGHQGPKEIGVGEKFFEWLTDPKLNGAGALVDFGCYGANIMTYLMEGKRPTSVTAITRTYKPEIYPDVDDDATIVVNYPNAQSIIQASWNWPFNRKDMEIYGETGYAVTENDTKMWVKDKNSDTRKELQLGAKETGVTRDPFTYFKKVIRKEIEVPEYGLYSLKNNLIVVEILEAARLSAKTGETIYFE